MAATAVLTVSNRPLLVNDNPGGRPAHHLDDTKTLFTNPWPSFRAHQLGQTIKVIGSMAVGSPSVPKDIETQVRSRKPTWGVDEVLGKADTGKLRATWLGHACFFLELPAPEGAERGARILFDPVFSHRCSPFTFMGPARHTKPPCTLDQIPSVDIIVISHNHYDHMDTETLLTLESLHQPHVFAPMGNDEYFSCLKIPKERIHCLDWWEGKDVTVKVSDTIKAKFAVTCTPAQHMTGRGLLDRFKTLWSSWAVEDLSGKDGVKAWFGGDTAYRTVHDGEDEDKVPVCPEFKRIGEQFGSFDLAMIPIGAYQPRGFMSAVHCAPQDSVRVFQDIRAKRAIGMHWGTWVLTTEPLMEPPRRLAEECDKIGIEKGAFDVCGLGETVSV